MAVFCLDLAGLVSVEISSDAEQGLGLCGSDLRQPGWRSSPEVKEMGRSRNLEERTKTEGKP